MLPVPFHKFVQRRADDFDVNKAIHPVTSCVCETAISVRFDERDQRLFFVKLTLVTEPRPLFTQWHVVVRHYASVRFDNSIHRPNNWCSMSRFELPQ